MKSISIVLCIFLMAGCASRNVTHHAAAYKECVTSQATTLDNGQDAPEDIAKLAAAQCQSNLELITEKLREENAWLEKGSNSDAYSESLRDRTVAEVTDEIRMKRQGK